MRQNPPATSTAPRPGRRPASLAVGGALLATGLLLAGCGSSKAASWATASTATTTATTTATSASSTPSQSAASSSPAAGTGSPAPAAASSAVPSTTVTVTRSVAAPAPSATSSGPTIDASRVSGIISFSSPSGRIACDASSYDAWQVRCDVEMNSGWYVPAAQQATCGEVGSMGSSAELPAVGRPHLFCQSDTVLGTTSRGQMGTEWVDTTPGAHWTTLRGFQQAVLPYNTTLRLPGGLSCIVRTTGMTCSNAGGHAFTVAVQGYHFS